MNKRGFVLIESLIFFVILAICIDLTANILFLEERIAHHEKESGWFYID